MAIDISIDINTTAQELHAIRAMINDLLGDGQPAEVSRPAETSETAGEPSSTRGVRRKKQEAVAQSEPAPTTTSAATSAPAASDTATAPTTQSAPASPSEPQQPTLTVQDVRNALKEYVDKHGMDEATKKLNTLGFKMVSEIPADRYAAVVAELKA